MLSRSPERSEEAAKHLYFARKSLFAAFRVALLRSTESI